MKLFAILLLLVGAFLLFDSLFGWQVLGVLGLSLSAMTRFGAAVLFLTFGAILLRTAINLGE